MAKKSKKSPKQDDNIIRKRSTSTLPVRLTTDELTAQAEIMANAEAELSTLEDQKKAATSEYKAKIDQVQACMSKAAALLRSKQEHRTVETEIVHDYRKATVTETRLDTGEVLSTRNMTQAECQLEMNSIVKMADAKKDDPKPVGTPMLNIVKDEKPPVTREQVLAAVELLRTTKRASLAGMQRRLKLTHAAAVDLMAELERLKIVGPANGDEPREIIADLDDENFGKNILETKDEGV